jgi:hypothetical protein
MSTNVLGFQWSHKITNICSGNKIDIPHLSLPEKLIHFYNISNFIEILVGKNVHGVQVAFHDFSICKYFSSR